MQRGLKGRRSQKRNDSNREGLPAGFEKEGVTCPPRYLNILALLNISRDQQ
jgi:hypothetical protein